MEIVKLAHVSNTTLKKNRQRLTAEVNEDDQKRKPLSPSSQAFKLFLECRSIVQVAIELDLATDQVLKLHSDYLILQNMEKAWRVLMENRKNLGAYLGLLDFVNGNKIKVRDLEHAVGLAKNMHNLERERKRN
jgi:hypothetical protein